MRNIYLFIALLGINSLSYGQAPASWTVDPSDFSNDMSVTAWLTIAGRVSDVSDDVVAAFINGQVVGVGSPSVFVPSTGQTVVFLTIYSNSPTGDVVSFQLYDSQNDQVINAINSLDFVSNSQVGSNTDAYLITDNYDPTDISLSATSIIENSPVGSTVGAMSTTDLNHTSGFVYSLVAGEGDTDNAFFSISGDQLLTAQELNFEVSATRSIRLQTTDPMGSSYQEAFTITITDENDAPTDIGIANLSFDENNSPGFVLSALVTTDEDAGDTFVYTLSGSDATAFEVNGSGQLVVLVSADFEIKSSYDITLTTQDQGGTGLTFEKAFTLNVVDINEAPTDITLSNNIVAEQAEIGTVIGMFTITDEDGGDTHTYDFFGDDTDPAFIISGTDLVLAAALDYDERSVYLITIKATDAGLNTFIKIFQIQVTNSKPEISNTEMSVEENTPNGEVIGTMVAIDPDDDPITYAFVFEDPFFDPNEAAFVIDSSTGAVSVNQSSELNYEKLTELTYTVRVTDEGGLTAEAFLKISIIDVIEAGGSLPFNEILTPNNDGYNDYFTIVNVELYVGYVLTIYNVNGNEVFSAENYTNDWAGVGSNGKELDAGVYYYRFTDGSILFKGRFTIIRN